ncbi:hypothetical protein HOY80DRAFT_867126, partial [Tuber brumale]
KIPEGATLVLIISSSDVIFLMNFSEDKNALLVYLTIGNLLSKTRNKLSAHLTALLALLPVRPKMLGNILYQLIEAILAPLTPIVPVRTEVECADSMVQQCFPYLAAWIADHLE